MNFENQSKNVLITGGCGFIGGTLVRKILKNTEWIIYNLDKISYASNSRDINELQKLKRYSLLKVDLSNFNDTEEAILKADPDYVIHLAAETHVDRSIDNSLPFIQSNILGTYNLLEICKKHWYGLDNPRKKEFRFLHISTDEVFGSLGKTGSFSEKTAYDPRSPYSASKAASDQLVNSWFHTFDFPTIRTNCSNNFGPYQFPEKLIPLVIIKSIGNLPIPIYGNGQNIRDWLFVEDHVDALLTVLQKGEIGDKYCIGGNNEKSNLEIVKDICDYLDKRRPKKNSYSNQIVFVKDRPGHDQRYSINANHIKEKLGWEPSFSFKESLKETIEWYLNNLDWCAELSDSSGYDGTRIGLGNL